MADQIKVKLQKSTFLNEAETKNRLCDFIQKADILSMSSECAKFEKRFSERQERQHSVMVNSGSSANLLLIQALKNMGRLADKDRVAFSALTWATNVMPLLQLGLTPVPVDCDLFSLNVSSETFQAALARESEIKALFITNTLGICADLSKIKDICDERGIILIEDNCESLGSRYDGRLLGNFGLASTFSLFVGHHLSAIEGGIVCTDDGELLDHLIMARAHGWDRGLSAESQRKMREDHSVDEFYANYTFYELGFNLRPTEINGFLANNQLGYWDFVVQTRQQNHNYLREIVKNSQKIFPLHTEHMDLLSSFAIPIVAQSVSDAEKFKSIFLDAGIEIRAMIAGNICNQPFYKKLGYGNFELPNAQLVHTNGFYFGNSPEYNDQELGVLSNAMLKIRD